MREEETKGKKERPGERKMRKDQGKEKCKYRSVIIIESMLNWLYFNGSII